MRPFPTALWSMGPIVVTDSMVVMLALSVLLVAGALVALRIPRARAAMEIGYEALERSIVETSSADVRALVPLIITLWLFLGAANLLDGKALGRPEPVVMVRPEWCRLGAGAAGCRWVWPGRVAGLTYTGAEVVADVACDNGLSLRVRARPWFQ